MAMQVVYVNRIMSNGDQVEIRKMVIPNAEFQTIDDVEKKYPQPKFILHGGGEELWDEPAPLKDRCPNERIFDRRVDALEWLNDKYNLTKEQFEAIDIELGAWVATEPPTSAELIWTHPDRCIEEFTEPLDVEAVIREYADANAVGENMDNHFPSRISESGLEKIYTALTSS